MTTHYQLRDDDAATDCHPVDYIEPEHDERSDLAEALVRIVLWMHASKEPERIGARAMTLAVALNLDLDNIISYADIGRLCGISREAVRQMAKELETEFGLRSHNSRSDRTRRRCKRSRNAVINREIARAARKE